MTNNLNSEMVILARDYRGITQGELALKIGVSQAKIARIEGGILTDFSSGLISSLSTALDFPESFFTQNEDRIGFGSSAYFYRKKAEISAADRRRIQGIVNLLRISVKKFVGFVEVGAKRTFPFFESRDYSHNPAKIAQALRGMWKLPDGPITNLTTLIESAGVIVIPCDFGTRAMDATSLRLTESPPLIFINKDIPGDRWRFTLAHELAHLVMHEIPHEMMEDEADAFAAELLMPTLEIKPYFSRNKKLRLADFANLKLYWKVSMGALIQRARTLGFIDENQHRYLWMTMSKLDYRLKEPNPIEREEPKTYRKILEYFTTTLGYAPQDFARLLCLNPRELESPVGVYSYGVLVEKSRTLTVVR